MVPVRLSLRWLIFPLVLVVIVASAPFWLPGLGSFLVKEQDPFKADMIVVLAGDQRGNRILKAAELVQRGFAPKVLVSGPGGFYGHYESDLAIAFIVKKGYPPDWFIAFPNQSTSTRQESALIIEELRRRNVRRFLVVTSNYHTRRADHLFRTLDPKAEFRVVAAPDWIFRPDSWWRTRDGQKQFAFEWMKTVAEWAGL